MTSPTQRGPQDGPEGDLLAQQIAYYRARADEYDEWFQLASLGFTANVTGTPEHFLVGSGVRR